MLEWDQTDFISAFEVLPEVEEYKTSHRFVIEKDGLRLELVVEQYAGDVYFTLHRDGIETRLFYMRIIDCPKARIIKYKGIEFIEFAPSRVYGGRYSNV